MSHILFIAGNTRSLIANRGDLIREMKRRGHRVTALVPSYDYLPEIGELDIPYRQISLNRAGVNPLKDYSSQRELKRIIAEINPDKVYAYTIKPVVYGVPAARRAGVPEVYAMITGMGYLFTGETVKQRLLRGIARRMYRKALKQCTGIFFQNPDDLQLFESLGIVRSGDPVSMTNGSGVNTEQFPRKPLPEGKPLTFLIIARLLQDKGVMEFVEAAKELKQKYGDKVRFQVLGPYDPNLPHAVPQHVYQAWQQNPDIELLGHQRDVRPYLEQCHVYVLPSYREGTPRSVLEAMSTGRPVITTDAPGCRETVKDDYNGFLVPAGQTKPLSTAMGYFIAHPEEISRMAENSYQRVLDKYDVHKVNEGILEAMGVVRDEVTK